MLGKALSSEVGRSCLWLHLTGITFVLWISLPSMGSRQIEMQEKRRKKKKHENKLLLGQSLFSNAAEPSMDQTQPCPTALKVADFI